METIEITGAVYAVVEILKKAGLPARFAFLASLIIGIAMGFIFFPDQPLEIKIMQGLSAGLIASGAYAGFKKTFAVAKTDDEKIADLIQGK